MLIELHPLADKEVLKSHRRYLRRSRIAARRFLEALDKAFEEVTSAPDIWPRHLFGTRFRRLDRFLYYVVYRQCPVKI